MLSPTPDGVNGANNDGRSAAEIISRRLRPRHLEDLRASGLSDDTILAGRFRSDSGAAIKDVLRWRGGTDKLGVCLLIPFLDRDGKPTGFTRVKPENPTEGDNGKPRKYEQPKGAPIRVYLPAGSWDRLLDPAQPLLITEGEKKAAKAAQEGFACVGLTGVTCWTAPREKDVKGKPVGEPALHPDLAGLPLAGRRVFIVFDSDATNNKSIRGTETRLAETLVKAGAAVRVVRLPAGPDGKKKVGLDDYLCAHSADDLRQLMEAAEEPAAGPIAVDEAVDDPHRLATSFLIAAHGLQACPTPRHWRSEWYEWTGGFYRRADEGDIRARLVAHIKNQFDEDYRRRFRYAEAHGETAEPVKKVGNELRGNVEQALKSVANLPGTVEAPAWIFGEETWPAGEVLVAPNALVHLPSLVAGHEDAVLDPTPTFFATGTIGCDFHADAPEPVNWLAFLKSVWPDDQESIDTLQEWFGYCLTPDTSHQKILTILGPPRSGKGTILRVLVALLGADNTAAPTLGSLATPFGLQPLVGRTLAGITDARISGRTDSAAIAERLLSISGEDAQTIDRKHLPPLTVPRLPVRFVLLSNEMPELSDSSGALVSRQIVLPQKASFLGKEDRGLRGRLLAELPSVLWWSIEGWRRLRDRGHFVQPASGANLVCHMQDLNSPVAAFVRAYCEVGPGLTEDKSRLFDGWKYYCETHGLRVLPAALFARNLWAVVPNLDDEQPRAEGGRRVRRWLGIRLDIEIPKPAPPD